MWIPQTPPSLLNFAIDGSLALIFGPDADLGTTYESLSETLPTRNGLRDLLCREHFNQDGQFDSLESLMHRIVQAQGPATLQAWLVKTSNAYTPNMASRSLPNFDWRGLCALGWDRSIETAYRLAARPLDTDGPRDGTATMTTLLRPLNWTNDSGFPQSLETGGHVRFDPNDVAAREHFQHLMTDGPVALFGVRPGDPELTTFLSDRPSGRPAFVSSPRPASDWPSGVVLHRALFADVMFALDYGVPRPTAPAPM